MTCASALVLKYQLNTNNGQQKTGLCHIAIKHQTGICNLAGLHSLSLHFMKSVFYYYFFPWFLKWRWQFSQYWETFNLKSVNERYLWVLQLSLVAYHFCMRWLKTSQAIKYIQFKNRHIFRIPAIFLGHKKAECFRWCYQVQKYLIWETRFKRYHFMPIVLAEDNKNSVC